MERFDSAVSFVAERIKTTLKNAESDVKENASEVTLRAEKPVVISLRGKSFMITKSGEPTGQTEDALICSKEELEDSFRRLCNFSVHSFQNNIVDGFITLGGGHRVGLCGTAVCFESGVLKSVRDISSLNIRIAREFKGSCDEVFAHLFKNKVSGLLIAGPPSSGKTTVLRDLIRRLSSFENGFEKKICVIDERNELAAMKNGVSLNDVGINSDVLSGYPKNAAIQTALRTMSPQVIACDEVSSEDEIEAIEQGANSGVVFIATVHAADFDDLVKRKQIKKLLNIGCFENVALLKGANEPGRILEIYEAEEVKDEIYRRHFGLDCDIGSRDNIG